MTRSQHERESLMREINALSHTLLGKLHEKTSRSPMLKEKETPKSPHAPPKQSPTDRAKPVNSPDPGTRDLLSMIEKYLDNANSKPADSLIQPGLALTDKEEHDFTVSKIPPAKQTQVVRNEKTGEEKEVQVTGDDRVAVFVKRPDGKEVPITVKGIKDNQIRPQ